MSDKSDDENKESISCGTQSQNRDHESHAAAEYDQIVGLSFPSLLEPNCTFPTELFYTLSPITLAVSGEDTDPLANRVTQLLGKTTLIVNDQRSRSYSDSGRTVPKRSGLDISSILRQSLKLRNEDISSRENIETQTDRSFLAEQAVHSRDITRDERPIDNSKAIQTSGSLFASDVADRRKEVKDISCQTSNSLDLSSFLRHLLKRQQKPTKASVGTQTIRSYLTEQALKRKKEKETKQIDRESPEPIVETKSIQTSYTSSINSEPDLTIVDERPNTYHQWTNEKQPISWFIPVDRKTQNRNISQIARTYTRKSGQKPRAKEAISVSSSPVPLQEAFNRHCIQMRANSQIRVDRIHTISELRKRTADERLIEMAKQFVRQQEASKLVRTKVIQPVFKSTIKRFFTHEEMRAQTERIYNNLPEVKAKREMIKQKEREKNQRLLARIYKYKLKDNALKGRLTWKITQSCLN